MGNLIRFKSYIEMLRVFGISAVIVGFYCIAMDTILQGLLPDLGTVLDITKWFRYF